MGKKVLPHKIFCFYQDPRGRKLYTKCLIKPAESHFGERLVRDNGETFREWDPKRSKLAATVANGCQNTGIREGSTILYLGASHGYTPSFVSDMIGPEGILFALDFSPETTRDLVFLAEKRKNIMPILADARQPDTFQGLVSQVDVIFMDVAQKDQAEIFLRNCKLFLKEDGVGLLAIKARSIDIRKNSKEICQEVREKVEKEFMVTDFRDLGPHEQDHYMLIIKKKKSSPGSVAKPGNNKGSRRKRPRDFDHRGSGRNRDNNRGRDSRRSDRGSRGSGRDRDAKGSRDRAKTFSEYRKKRI